MMENYSYYIFKKENICVSILTKFTIGYLGVKGKLHNSQCLIYIFTGKVIDGSPKKIH